MKRHTSLLKLVSLCAAFFQSLMLVKSLSFDLIHRDSPLSPFYNKFISQSEILVKDAHRSHAQVSRLENSSFAYTKELMESTMESSGKTYLIKYYLGSDKFEVSAFVSLETGFTWTKCLSKDQKQEEKVYKWDESTSYTTLQHSKEDYRCNWFPNIEPDPSSTDCAYIIYDDDYEKVSTKGVIGTDNFYSLQAQMVVEYGNIFFGCSYINEGFASEVEGVLGLGRGLATVLSVLKEKTKNKFSYCLRAPTSEEKVSILRFGDNSPSIEAKMTSIKFGGNTGYLDSTSQYYLHLEGVSIGDNNIKKPESRQSIIIDLGISMTYLTESIYQQIEDTVTEMFDTDKDPLPEFKICFDNTDDNRNRLPEMTFHFKDGANYTLNPSNIFAESDHKFCLAIFESEKAISRLGSKAQQNHIMQFDIPQNRLSFTNPGDCNSFEE